MMTPKDAGLERVEPGLLKFALLGRLKASPRNWSVVFSSILKDRVRLISRVKDPGPLKLL